MPTQLLVTGGSRGIGLACALQQARSGQEVWIAARQRTGLQAACAEAEKQGLRLHSVELDVSQPQAFEALSSRHPDLRPQALIHAAGISAYSGILDPDDPQMWQRSLDSNLNGSYYASRWALKHMKSGGRVVVINSVLGLRGMRNSHAYCAAKHGQIGLVRALAQDFIGQGITINAICPGWVDTEMGRESMRNMADYYNIPADLLTQEEIAAVPIQRWIQVDEVAAMAGYLLSERAQAVTGQAFEISGGLT